MSPHEKNQLTLIGEDVALLKRAVIGDGSVGNPPLMQRVASLEEERGRRRWTMRLLVTTVAGLVGQWLYSLMHGGRQ